jgi:hypothetical protein
MMITLNLPSFTEIRERRRLATGERSDAEVNAIARTLFKDAHLKQGTVIKRDGKREEGQIHVADDHLSVIATGFAMPIPYTKVAKVELGDKLGHPFRGNQWGGTSAHDLVTRTANARKTVNRSQTRWMKKHGIDPEQALAQVKKVVGDAKVGVRVPGGVLRDILDDGRLHNGYVPGNKRASGDQTLQGLNSKREQFENQDYGYTSDTPIAERPIYGYLFNDPASRTEASLYGDTLIELKRNAVENRTTFMFGDSLEDNRAHDGLAQRAPVALTHPTVQAGVDALYGRTFNRATVASVDEGVAHRSGGVGSYTEAQIHGGVTLDEIQAVYVPKNFLISPITAREKPWLVAGSATHDDLNALEKAGVAVYVMPVTGSSGSKERWAT